MTLPQAKRWNQNRWLTTWYGALARLGVKIVILRPGVPWPKDLPLIVAPSVQMVDDALVAQMGAYARSGGNLLLTCRTGLMDRTGQLWEGPLAKPILPLINAEITSYDGMREDTFAKIRFEDHDYQWGVWADQIKPGPGAQVLATYADQFYAGAPAITRTVQGKGSVTYFGACSEPPLVEAFVQSFAKTLGPDRLAAQPLSSRVQVLRRGPYKIALNYNDKPVPTPAPPGAHFIIGSSQLAPADVAVWEE